MPRQKRHSEADTIYHVTARGVERRMIYLSDSDRQDFMVHLLSALRESRASLFAYCLMGNHFHLLLARGEFPLDVPLRIALTTYAVRFNTRNQRVGHLFQARFFSHPIHEPTYLHDCIAYIHANPVRAGLVKHVDEWKWSSHGDWRSLTDKPIDFKRLSELTDIPTSVMRDEYRRRVEAMSTDGPKGLSLGALIKDTARMLGISADTLTSGASGSLYTKAKLLLIERARVEGYSIRELAEALGCSPAALCMAQKRKNVTRPFC